MGSDDPDVWTHGSLLDHGASMPTAVHLAASRDTADQNTWTVGGDGAARYPMENGSFVARSPSSARCAADGVRRPVPIRSASSSENV